MADSEGWDATTDPYAYLTAYTAMNHPNETMAEGYDFIGYDFSYALFVEADPESCAEATLDDGGTLEVCGEYLIEEDGSGGLRYKLGDHREDEGSRYATSCLSLVVRHSNLDLDLMKEGFLFDGVE